MNARLLFLCLVLLLPLSATAQGYAGLGTEARGFALPERGRVLQFPADHGPHPEFRIEWWYLTANLIGEDEQEYGIQWTLFRSALAPQVVQGWDSPQIWMGHAGLTTPENHYFAEKLARGGIGQAGVSSDPFVAWIDNWEMRSSEAGIDRLGLSASGAAFAYDLDLTASTPLVLHGDAGYSVKSREGQASHYYSQPRYAVRGTLRLPDGEVKVTGHGWLDREWSSQPLAEDQTGWDWFSLSFEDGAQLMGFVLRGDGPDFTSGTWIDPDGTATSLAPGAFQAEPLGTARVAEREIPTRWQVTLPDRQLEVVVEALNPDSWMGAAFAYWEGPVRISGSHQGRGYLEMTGYE